MKILIVGSSSFLGANLISTLSKLPFQITGLQRGKNSTTLSKIEILSWHLGQQIPPDHLDSSDWIIFCAHDFKNTSLTKSGYQILLSQLRNTKNTKCIFVSSYSAFKDAPSEYGKTKYELENEFLAHGHYIIRPGLIIGTGGMFAGLSHNILKYPIVPIIGFRDAPIFYISVQDLCQFIVKIIEMSPSKKEYNAFYETSLTQVQMARAVKETHGKNLFYLRLPVAFFELAIWLFHLAGLKPPITKENLQGYKRNTHETRPSDIDFLNEKPETSLAQILKKNS